MDLYLQLGTVRGPPGFLMFILKSFSLLSAVLDEDMLGQEGDGGIVMQAMS